MNVLTPSKKNDNKIVQLHKWIKQRVKNIQEREREGWLKKEERERLNAKAEDKRRERKKRQKDIGGREREREKERVFIRPYI